MGITGFDNRVIDVTSQGEGDFRKALSFFFSKETKVSHYEINKEYGLILYWTDADLNDITALPYKMDYDAAVNFAWNWLKTAEYKEQPDHDGDNKEGFQIYNKCWGHVSSRWQVLVAIRPVWAIYAR